MFVLRKDQIAALGRYALQEFENNMAQHLRAGFPVQTGILSEDALRGLVQFGIAAAREHGVVLEKDVRWYLECMIVYGRNFEADPRMAWGGRVLRTQSLTGTQKMDHMSCRGGSKPSRSNERRKNS